MNQTYVMLTPLGKAALIKADIGFLDDVRNVALADLGVFEHDPEGVVSENLVVEEILLREYVKYLAAQIQRLEEQYYAITGTFANEIPF